MTDKRELNINTQRAMLDITTPMDYDIMLEYLNVMCERYKFMSLTYIGESILGRAIPMITLGEGKKCVMYIGAHSGADWIGSAALLRFINEYCEIKKGGGRIYNYSVEYLFATRRICIVPMLNPDGVDININGVTEGNILGERIMSMRKERDFSDWQANARGVTLQDNYVSGFLSRRDAAVQKGIVSGAPLGFCGEAPESEPETGALCAHIRFEEGLCAALCLNGTGDTIFYRTDKKAPVRGKSIAVAAARMNGYKLQKDADGAGWCGFLEWCIDEVGIPALEIPCKEINKNFTNTYFEIYSRQREILFTLPAII